MSPSPAQLMTPLSKSPPVYNHKEQEEIPPSGNYWIQTSDDRLYVILADGNRGTPFTTTNSVNDENIRFEVTKLTNNNEGDYVDPPQDEEYNIASFQYANYAVLSQNNTKVEGKADPDRWVIKEIEFKGRYWICSPQETHPKVYYWTLDNHNPGATVKLISDSSKAQVWKLIREFH